jgi:molybdopterin molybdotransferase
MISFQQAQEIISTHSTFWGAETVALDDSLNRVLAEDIYADRHYPPFNRAAMDGFAIRLQDWEAGQTDFQIVAELLAGAKFDTQLQAPHTAVRIMTGAATPEYYDCIVRIEDCLFDGSKVSFSIKQLKKWQNIARMGEDAQAAQKIIAKGETIHLGSIIALASVGAVKIKVYKNPQVCILTTGDEIVSVHVSPTALQIRNSNAHCLISAVKSLGLSNIRHIHLSDSLDIISQTIDNVIENADIILFTGGVSAGNADFVPAALAKSGFEKLFHKISIKPGKPAWFGKHISLNKVVFALPGNPVSVLTTFKILVEPYILKSIGKNSINYSWHQLVIDRAQKVKLDEFFPVSLVSNSIGEFVEPVKINGSGDITATLNATGLALHPIDQENLKAGSFVKVFRL